MNVKFILLFLGAGLFGELLSAQTTRIKGTVIDAETKETLIGCAVVIQGTTIGTITNFDGNFELTNVAPGAYNLVVSYVSYTQQIVRVDVQKDQTTTVDIQLKPSTVVLDDIKVVATKRTNTELSMISTIKASNLVTSGISSQQILKSQDKDASEVIKRVPGINIRDGRFVVVRGLSERYNTVWLNNAAAPSSESDIRAFSFDVIPSNQLENLIIYKSPAPELPADFAGGVIKIFTKNTAYDDKINISYSLGYQEGTTFKKFDTYKGGKTDWLGFDDGTRALPAGMPSTQELREWNDTGDKTPEEIEANHQKAIALAKSFNRIWSPYTKNAGPNQSFSVDVSKRFLIGKISVGSINALTYNNSNDINSILRAGYQKYDTHTNPLYQYNDLVYKNEARVGAMTNWSFIFGNNQKIQLRNLLNQNGQSSATLRDGIDYYNTKLIKSYELAYKSRTTYTGQLAGEHKFNHDKTEMDWVLGYSYANKRQPDIRRVRYAKSAEDPEAPYLLTIYHDVNPDLLGRIHLSNDEHIWTLGTNLVEHFFFGNWTPDLKAGFYSEFKSREFVARNIGVIRAGNSFNYNLQSLPIDSVFLDENINYTNGITISESTNKSDSYNASNKLFAGYLGLNLPVGEKLNIYGGVRMEKNRQVLNSYDRTDKPVHYVNDTLNFFPSLNLSYKFTDKLMLRGAYGKTVNRPEFREIAPYAFYDFEENAVVEGDTLIKNCYIDNYDLRVEWYPNSGDMISIAAFYKTFSSPIEAILESAGTGWNYKFKNADKAISKGIELDLRKSLSFLNGDNRIVSFLKNITLVFNTSLINSNLTSTDPNSRDKNRLMQGQAPYIINGGLFYNNPQGLMVSLLYNEVGKHIVFVGSQDYANIYEQPKHQLDLTIEKEFNNHLKLKAGIKNVLNDKILLQNIKGDHDVNENQPTKRFLPGRSYNVGITYSF